MRRLLQLLMLLAIGAAAPRHAVHAEDGHRALIDDHTFDKIITVTTMALMGTSICGIGDQAVWSRVLEAIELRYWACVGENPMWTVWMEGRTDLQPFLKKGEGDKVGIGMLAFRQELGKLTESANAVGRAAYCTLSPWKLILDPDAVTAEQRAAYKRENPNGKIDELLDLFSRVRALGDDQRWIEASCDGGFFPLSYFSNKR